MSAFGNIGSGYDGVKFNTVGDAIAGRIVSFEDFQVTEFADDPKRGVKKGDPKVFPSGDPILGVKVNLETEPGNEGSRVTLWVEKPAMLKAIATAFRQAGKTDVAVGDDLAVTFTGYNGRAKAFSAAYSPADAE